MCGAQNLGALRKPVAPTLAWCLGWWWSGGDETGPVSPHLNMLPMFLDAGFSFFFQVFSDLFLAVLGLCCCMDSSGCREWGSSPVAVCGLLAVAASLVVEHGLSAVRLRLQSLQ